MLPGVKALKSVFKNKFLVLYREMGYMEHPLNSILVTTTGEKEELSCVINRHDTDITGSCSVTWQNKLFVYGGFTQKRQISVLDGYRLSLVGYLDFEFYKGACTQMNDQFIFLCFSWPDSNSRCRRYTDPLGAPLMVVNSKIGHSEIQISASKSEF